MSHQEDLMNAIQLLEYEIGIMDAFIANADAMYSKHEYVDRMVKIAQAIKKIRQEDIEDYKAKLLVH